MRSQREMQTETLQAALSRQQERLWKWLQDGRVGNPQVMALLEGAFKPDCFQRALLQLVERYEILRTTFSVTPGMDIPMQVITQNRDIPCSFVNLQPLKASTQRAVLAAYWQELPQYSFDLTHGPLMHIKLIQLKEQQSILMLSMSALCADICTLKHLITEVMEIYAILERGDCWSEEEEALQYIDVISWQRDLLNSESTVQQRAFWSKLQLEQLAALPLPFQYSSEASRNSSGQGKVSMPQAQQVEIALNAEQQRQLLKLSQDNQVPPE